MPEMTRMQDSNKQEIEFAVNKDGRVSCAAGEFHVCITFSPVVGESFVLSMLTTREIPSSFFPSTSEDMEIRDLRSCGNVPLNMKRFCLREV